MKILAKNSRARHDYEIGEKFLAGIVLSGQEVKSVKTGAISLKGSFINFKGQEAYLTNASISAYKHASKLEGYEPTGDRKILLTRKEITMLQEKVQTEGMAVLPLAVGLNHGFIKVEIGLGRGKKRYDKRYTIKQRDMLRDASRDTKNKV